MLSINPSEIPEGSDYQWAARSVSGDESLGDVIRLRKTGWREVPRARHPQMQTSDPKWIVSGGLVLMERPLLLTKRAKEWEANKADAQIVENIRSVMRGYDGAMVMLVNVREINMEATTIRKTTIREFFTKHLWALRVWWRNLFIKEV